MTAPNCGFLHSHWDLGHRSEGEQAETASELEALETAWNRNQATWGGVLTWVLTGRGPL